jgi:hypothetical protein
MANNEDHDMGNTAAPTSASASASVNLALRSSTNTPSDKKTNASRDESTSDSDASSSSEESDDSTSDGEDEDDEIATIKPGTKPNFSAQVASGAPSLADRLKSFLPQMAEANSKLEQGDANEYSMEAVKDDEPHIEMDLGLGVLEETNGKDGDDSDDDEDENLEEDASASPERKRKEKDVMGKLMGKKENQTAGIEEVG